MAESDPGLERILIAAVEDVARGCGVQMEQVGKASDITFMVRSKKTGRWVEAGGFRPSGSEPRYSVRVARPNKGEEFTIVVLEGNFYRLEYKPDGRSLTSIHLRHGELEHHFVIDGWAKSIVGCAFR